MAIAVQQGMAATVSTELESVLYMAIKLSSLEPLHWVRAAPDDSDAKFAAMCNAHTFEEKVRPSLPEQNSFCMFCLFLPCCWRGRAAYMHQNPVVHPLHRHQLHAEEGGPCTVASVIKPHTLGTAVLLALSSSPVRHCLNLRSVLCGQVMKRNLEPHRSLIRALHGVFFRAGPASREGIVTTYVYRTDVQPQEVLKALDAWWAAPPTCSWRNDHDTFCLAFCRLRHQPGDVPCG